ncbi:MAG: c-type cytochrome [Bacteroidia bacterium]
MNKKTKWLLFTLLFLAYIVFTALVDTIGTADDKGAAYLSPSAKKGKLLFQKYNCGACHQIYGLGGYMGPDLTNVMSIPLIGETYARSILANGTNKMPNFKLTPEEIDDLIAYFLYVDKTGISPVKKFQINSDGTVNFEQ